MKSLVHTEELCSRSVPLEHALGAKPLVCNELQQDPFVSLFRGGFKISMYQETV